MCAALFFVEPHFIRLFLWNYRWWLGEAVKLARVGVFSGLNRGDVLVVSSSQIYVTGKLPSITSISACVENWRLWKHIFSFCFFYLYVHVTFMYMLFYVKLYKYAHCSDKQSLPLTL